MISFLEGTIEYRGDKYIILNTGGIGYKVTISPKSLNIVSKSSPNVNKVKLFVHSQLNMRDGTFDMYGFQNKEELELFNLVTSVNGIGPKSAMGILSAVEPKHLKAAVINNDADYLKKGSGLGPQKPPRLVFGVKKKNVYLGICGILGGGL